MTTGFGWHLFGNWVLILEVFWFNGFRLISLIRGISMEFPRFCCLGAVKTGIGKLLGKEEVGFFGF